MSLARKLTPSPPAGMASQRGDVDAWDAWLRDHDPDGGHHRRGYPDPVGDAAAANVDRQRRGR